MINYFDAKIWDDRLRLACFECGKTEESSSREFEEIKHELAVRTGFDIRMMTFEVRGKCRLCKAKVNARIERFQPVENVRSENVCSIDSRRT